jgi:hypothetical protein
MKTITRLDIVFCAVSERIADYVSRAVKITVHVALWAATVALALAIFDGFVFVASAGADWLAKHGPNLSGLFGPGRTPRLDRGHLLVDCAGVLRRMRGLGFDRATDRATAR